VFFFAFVSVPFPPLYSYDEVHSSACSAGRHCPFLISADAYPTDTEGFFPPFLVEGCWRGFAYSVEVTSPGWAGASPVPPPSGFSEHGMLVIIFLKIWGQAVPLGAAATGRGPRLSLSSPDSAARKIIDFLRSCYNPPQQMLVRVGLTNRHDLNDEARRWVGGPLVRPGRLRQDPRHSPHLAPVGNRPPLFKPVYLLAANKIFKILLTRRPVRPAGSVRAKNSFRARPVLSSFFISAHGV